MNELILYPNDEKQIPIETSIFFPEQKALLSEGDANKNKERNFINKENEYRSRYKEFRYEFDDLLHMERELIKKMKQIK